MDFLTLAKKRYSLRKFSNRPVEPEILDQILEAARIAPTATNAQPVRILVLESQEDKDLVPQCTRYHFGAPLFLLVCYDKEISWKRQKFDGKEMGEVDASIAATHMMLEAASLGLGTTWVAYFDPKAARELFEVPDRLEIVCLLPLGYPADDAAPSPKHEQREALEHMVHVHRFEP